MGMKPGGPNRNNSILFLALLCLLYYLTAFNPQNPTSTKAMYINSPENIYIEVTQGKTSAVLILKGYEDLANIKTKYNIDSELVNGDKVLLEGGKGTRTGRISGLKSLSLGVPVGINSAGAEDLRALPGIGEKLAERILSYREAHGRFNNLEELEKVNGMGEKKLSAVKNLVSLD